jgi:OOP family OmpA-OmpF porin
MADDSTSRIANPETPDAPPEGDRALQELRELLVKPEQQELSALRERIDNPASRARDVSSVVAEAIRIRCEEGGSAEISNALGPPVEEALKESVRKDPSHLANALFPVMGPAIRKAVTESIRAMLESFNEALENSLSIRGIKWRIEALRTGRSYAEVVLLRSVIYRVEQIFLIHKRTSLLLQHVIAPSIEAQDPFMVSGMLSAIQDFVRDSFHTPQAQALDSLRVGELLVWVEDGPDAVLAAVIRGNPPPELRVTLRQKLEDFHRRFGGALGKFEGDAAPFEAFQENLTPCLEARYAQVEPRKPRPFAHVLIAALAILLVAWKAVSYYQDRRWERFAGDLHQQPGFVITSYTKEGGQYHIQGLRDPLAEDPGTLLEKAGLDPSRVDFRLSPYYSLEDRMILKRAVAILRPPATAVLTLQDGVLSVAGEAPYGWARRVPGRGRLIAGVRAVDERTLRVPDGVDGPRSAVESATVLFAPGDASVADDQRPRLQQVTSDIRILLARAEAFSERFVIEVVGHTDTTGAESLNALLSQRRATRVVSELVRAGMNPGALRARGVGTTEPVRPELTEADRAYNRSVTFRVISMSPEGSY